MLRQAQHERREESYRAVRAELVEAYEHVLLCIKSAY
jgi:hypothetical protein